MSYNAKLSALECSLQQSIANYKDIVKDFENLCFESEDYKMKFINQKEKCESKSCCGSEAFKKTIETKDNIIQQVALVLSKLYETKNFNIINEAFKLICGDATSHLKMELPKDKCDTEKLTVKIEMNTPKKELSDFIQDVSYKEESSSEIEGTPGRTSPIIQSKKQRNGITNKSSDNRDKKKCPDNWPTPENKVVKLIYPTPSRSRANGKLRQTRFSVVKLRTSNVVDLTSSPELMSARASHEDCKPLVQQLVKKESTDNDDTILPSPTSGPPKYPSLLKNTCKSSPFKKPPLSLKPKLEIKLDPNENVENSPTINFKCVDANDESINLLKPIRSKEMKENSPKKEHSIDYDETNCEIASSLSILQRVDMMEQHQEHNDKTPRLSLRLDEHMAQLEVELERIRWHILGLSEVRRAGEDTVTLESGHLLYFREGDQHSQGGFGFLVNKVNDHRRQMLVNFLELEGLFLLNSFFKKRPHRRWTWQSPDTVTKNEIDFIMTDKSPKKRPLEANINLCNVPEVDTDASMSLLRREPTFGKPSEEKLKRNLPECAEPVYKEPTLRKKMEKRALPGWSCEQCRIFYDELYKDDLEMLAKKMDECSKHRGRNNPGRPKTPDGFWNPRWDVPDDTEEFNRRNNAV